VFFQFFVSICFDYDKSADDFAAKFKTIENVKSDPPFSRIFLKNGYIIVKKRRLNVLNVVLFP
jgi:hypothetical protein